ncbi:hypothetical protein [Streptomyces sp. NPDC058953]|uniref:hypothetical protein n=1 Tax=unclassified Streptomyces TaxID=2593676 RepID=UPI0036BD008D
MPRPTAAQIASGSATVVFSALALLLFTRTDHAVGVAAIGVVSMALGLLVATALPMSRALRAAGANRPAAPATSASSPARPRAHAGAGADSGLR